MYSSEVWGFRKASQVKHRTYLSLNIHKYRMFSARLRMISHRLAVESGRLRIPSGVHLNERTCHWFTANAQNNKIGNYEDSV
jgi:hypothetical protein